MTMDSNTETAVRKALAAVLTAAQAANDAPDLTAAKAALNSAWFAIAEAQKTINLADAETRLAALAKLKEPA